jgi:hypothetical protein
MTTAAHRGVIRSVDIARREAVVTMEGTGCRVCGGQGCLRRARTVTVAVPECSDDSCFLRPGDSVQVTVPVQALVRGVVRVLLLPTVTGTGVWIITGSPGWMVLAVAAALAIPLVSGGRHRDLPRIVPFSEPASPFPPGGEAE